eukprot:9325100-Pyramimonas_sp.AAC.1
MPRPPKSLTRSDVPAVARPAVSAAAAASFAPKLAGRFGARVGRRGRRDTPANAERASPLPQRGFCKPSCER